MVKPLIPLLACMLVMAVGFPSHSAAQPPSRLEIGVLLLAIDVQPDHLRISEGFRIGNPGPRQVRALTIRLPAGAAHLVVHKGLESVRSTSEGFSARMTVPTGVTEVAYSYALAVQRDAVLSRTFPLSARRIEVIVRGEDVRVAVREGSTLPPADLAGGPLRRWEVRDLAAGSPLVVGLSDLPTRRSRVPLAATLGLAGVLAAALLLSAATKRDAPFV